MQARIHQHSTRVGARLSVLAGLLHFGTFAALAELNVPLKLAGKGNEQAARNPVLLVHGIHDTSTSMRAMSNWLASQGWEVHTIDLMPNDGSERLETLAKQINTYVSKQFSPERKIDLVGFSMGGVVCRYYLQRLGGAERVQRFVTISAPNNGTWLACMSNKRGCMQMRPGSEFLRALNADGDALQKLQVTCIWTPFDLTILPATSSRLPFGKEVMKRVVAHPLMVRYSGCLRAVTEALLDLR
jgi:triacylglycerol lipase